MLMHRLFPLANFDDVYGEIDRVFDAFSRDTAFPATGRHPAFPAINVWEDAECVFVEAEVPGVTMDDLDIEVVGNELSIKGERKPFGNDDLSYRRRERGVGTFSRFLSLATEVDTEKVSAALKDGVLTITLPKAAAARARKIKVQTA